MANDPPATGSKLASDAAKAMNEVRKGALETSDSVTAASGDIAGDLRQLKTDLARLTETVTAIASNRGARAASRVGDGVRSVTDTFSATASDAYTAGSDIASSARHHASSFAGDVEKTVRRNPLGAVLASMVLGMVVGMLSRSR